METAIKSPVENKGDRSIVRAGIIVPVPFALSQPTTDTVFPREHSVNLVPHISPKSAAIIFAALFAFDIAHRVLTLSAGPFPLAHDGLGYWQLAEQMSAGDWFMSSPPSAFRTPLYPAYLAVFQMFFGQWAFQAAIAGQHVLGIGTSLVTAWMCGQLWRNMCGFLLGYACSMCCLGRLQFDSMAYSESLVTFTLTLHAACILNWYLRGRRRDAFFMGITLAANILVRPTLQAFPIIECVVIVVSRKGVGLPLRVRAAHALLFAISLTAFMAPWVIRNHILYGKLFLTKGLGVRLWASCFSHDGAGLPLPEEDFERFAPTLNWRHEWSVYTALRISGMSESQRDEWMKAESLRAIRRNPGQYANRALANWMKHWYVINEAIPWYPRYTPPAAERNPYLGQTVWHNDWLTRQIHGPMRFVYRYSQIWSGITSCIGLCSACFLARTSANRGLWIILLLCLLYSATMSAVVIIPLYRFRMVTEPLMILATIAALGEMMSGKCSTARDLIK